MNTRYTIRLPEVSQDALKNFAVIMLCLQTISASIFNNRLIGLSDFNPEELSEAMASDSGFMALSGIGVLLTLLGGLAVPVFSWLLFQGFILTSNYRNYLIRLLVFAVISEVPYDLAYGGRTIDTDSQNPLLGLVLSLLMLYFLRMVDTDNKVSAVGGSILIILAAVIWVSIIRVRCGLCVILLAAIFYKFKNNSTISTVLGVIVSLMYFPAPLSFYGIACCNERRGDRINKWIYYILYPAHLLLFALISKMI